MITKDVAAPDSAVRLPIDQRFSDDQKGVEARILIAGWADRLNVAAAQHEPVQVIRDIVARLNEIVVEATLSEMTRLVKAGRAN